MDIRTNTTLTETSEFPWGHHHRLCSDYSFDELAEIYNQSRVDYIVPMPMNGKRMQEYAINYDIVLQGSPISINEDQLETGIGMLGMRGDRGWITRLGVIPERRERKQGQYIMEVMLDEAAQRGAMLIQLEVIVGNEPARNLFLKLGFEDTRELLIIRRPPAKLVPDSILEIGEIEEIPTEQIPDYLALREPGASWVEETASLVNGGNLKGLTLHLPDGDEGWIVFQRSAFQLQHLVFCPDASERVMHGLLYHLHRLNPLQDTKVENVPVDHHTWPVFQKMGYFEVFRRHEMFLYR